jgi:hypothetical protein
MEQKIHSAEEANALKEYRRRYYEQNKDKYKKANSEEANAYLRKYHQHKKEEDKEIMVEGWKKTVETSPEKVLNVLIKLTEEHPCIAKSLFIRAQ